MLPSPQELYEVFGFYVADRFVQVRTPYSYSVRCLHQKPINFKALSEDQIFEIKGRDIDVYLSPQHTKDGKEFRAGQCSVCG